MTAHYYRLPTDLAGDIDIYEREVQQFLSGELPGGVLKAKRVPRGVYEQRQDGTYMVRVRVAGGTLTCEQTRELAVLATEYGNGFLHATSRQDVQLHDISIGDTPGIMRRLMGVGLTSKGGGGNTVRNVAACPYTGICPHEHFDVTPFAHAVTEYLIPLVGSYNLPRKYKIAFSGCAADCALAQVADLGFIAETRDDLPGFRVVAGGGMGAHSRVADDLLEWVSASEVIRIAEAVRLLFDRLGDRSTRHRARLRYVFERLGVDAFRERFVQQIRDVAEDGVPEWEGESLLNSTRIEGTSGLPELGAVDGVRCFSQRRRDFVAVPMHLPLGFVSADDFARIGDIAARFSEEDGLRTTRMQNLLIRSVRKEDVRRLADELGQLDADVLSTVPLERFVACAGASTCRLGLCLARGAAGACAEGLADANIKPDTFNAMDIHINGCPNACGHQPIGPIGFFGAAQRIDGRLVPCYRITLGGRCNENGARLGVPVGQVPAKALSVFLNAIARDFESGRRDGESFSSYFDGMGKEHFERIVSHHAKVPAYDENPEFYRDFGVAEDFSLAGRGTGECGAGVFDLIQEDLIAARKAKEPFDILLPTVRALLITRGVDARDPDGAFREFEKHFIDVGLVAEDFRTLLARARGYTQGWKQAFDGYEETVGKLLERVEFLYSTLDANLEFHPSLSPDGVSGEADLSGRSPGAKTDTRPPTGRQGRTSDTAVELDLRGVTCPMNFVKAKLRLESMNIGETLAIVLDDGDPILNVPASFRNEGQGVEGIMALGDGHWRVLVTKRK